MASAGPYAGLHFATTTPAPTTLFFTGRMPFLPPNQQRQSTEGTVHDYHLLQNLCGGHVCRLDRMFTLCQDHGPRS